ncbi:MAG: hypothetical protein K9H65_00930 [Bacteroidales bacterium]|nr:hypothetical protein [Bacteroidales bacterium]
MNSYKIINKKIIIGTNGRLCDTSSEVIHSKLFHEIVSKGIKKLCDKNSIYTQKLDIKHVEEQIKQIVDIFELLSKNHISIVRNIRPDAENLLQYPTELNNVLEFLYNYWREFERYIVCDSQSDNLDERPYRTFDETVERLTHLVRKIYRDISENIISQHPRTYRQVNSGAEFACISYPAKEIFSSNSRFDNIKDIPLIRQIMMNPPLILETPMNKRKGQFVEIDQNPLELVVLNQNEWLCYPAKVGDLLIFIYFHQRFFELGFSACNLFEIAPKEDLNRKPDAIYLYGVSEDALNGLAEIPTVFHEDKENDMFIGACPRNDEFGYFGYLKKMVLTLHNSIKIKKGILPFHGSLVEISLQSGKRASILMIGDTGAGKSETLEAYKQLGGDLISETTIISDDMGSVEIEKDGTVRGIGTEIGAFLRLDDLQPGYAFGQIDRSILMNAHLTNARIILPVTFYETVLKGTKIDYIFYANNYEEVTDDKPVIERIPDAEKALDIFSKGNVMSKGTTTSTGLVSSYFANIFGPVQYKEEHDQIAEKYFNHFYQHGVFVGQIRTQLGIQGMEQEGPEIAARELIEMIS